MSPVLKAFLRNPAGILGTLILLLVVLIAVFAGVLFPQSPWSIVAMPFDPPGAEGMWFGTDTLGRNVAAGVAYGARISLIIGIASTFAALVIGVALGCLAGFAGGWVDRVIVRFTEIFQTIPNFVLALLLVAILQPTLWTIIFAIGITSWPPLARLTRAQVKAVASRDFVVAARCQGQSSASILFRHVLPNAMSPIIVTASLTVAAAILIEAALSFMGLGDPNFMSWGYLIGQGRTVMEQAWWVSVFPGLAILITVIAINLVGEALNDALNPRISRA